MSSSLKQVIELLDAIARMNERLVALEQRFWTQPEIARVIARWTYVDMTTVW